MHSTHVLGLLFSDAEQRATYAGCLQAAGFRVHAAGAEEAMAEGYLEGWAGLSLVLADEGAAQALGPELLALKWRSGSTLLPILLALPQTPDSTPWLQAGFDDVVRLPATEVELAARVDVFLRLREQSHEQYRAFVENALVGIFRLSRGGRLLLANPSLIRMLGCTTPDEAAELVRTWAGAPDHPIRRFWDHLAERNEVAGEEICWRNWQGGETWALIHAHTVRGATGQVLYYEGTAEEITARKRADQQQAVQYAVTRTLSEGEAEAAVFPELLRTLCLGLGWELGELWLEDAAEKGMRCASAWSMALGRFGEFIAASRDAVLPINGSLPGLVLRTGQPAWRGDLAVPSGFFRAELAEQAGLRCALGAPIYTGAAVRGALLLFSAESRARDPGLERMLADIGSQVGQFIRRKRIEAELERSETRLSGILEIAEDAIVSIGADQRIVMFNRGAERIFGYTAAEVLGRPLDLLLPPRIVEPHRTYVAGFAGSARRMGERSEVMGRRRDGTLFPAEASISRLDLPDETLFTAMLRDISARKAAEQALRDSEERFRLVALATNDAVWDLDFRTDQCWWNETVQQMFGYPVSQAGSRDWWEERVHPEDREAITATLDGVVESGEQFWCGEYRFRRADGTYATVFDRGYLLRDLEHRPIRMIGSMMDISARKHAEEQLEQSNRELEEFAYVASHDLQEPLRKIRAFGDRLEQKYAAALGEEGKDYLERMQLAAARMQALIQDLLAFSRISSRGRAFVRVDLSRAAADALSDLETQVEAVGGQVEVADLPTIWGDPTQLRRLFQNLISNALKFHQEGVSPRVRVSAAPPASAGRGADAGFCRLEVADNGIGFAEKYLDRIFNPFQRLHGRTHFPGTGMGLAICRKIAQRHGGSITAQSSPGEGATFVVLLPLRQEEEGDGNGANP